LSIRQTLETAAAEALEAKGRRIRVSLHPDHAHEIGAPPVMTEEAEQERGTR
jgi:hypothetical protein